MFDYAQSGLVLGKRLQAQETFKWYVNNVLQTSTQTINMDGYYTYDTGGEGKVASVNYPKTYSWNGTNVVTTTGPTYTYSFDAMMRPTGLKDQNNNTLVNNVTYNAANQLLTFNTETHQYNNLNQMTRLTITGAQPLDISYNFPAGTNNGKISTQTDNLSAETVTYQDDSLNRLLSATSSQSWSETYGFDGFGNLLSKASVGGAPALSQSVDPATNHIIGQSYDSNGNQTSGGLYPVTYDAENRVASVSSAGVQYAYDSQNKRIWSSTLSGGNLTQIFYYYGTDGQKLGIYPLTLAFLQNGTTPVMTDNTNVKLSTFFGSKRIGTYDRLGTAKFDQQNGGAMSFYPYGEDRGTVQPNDSLKFATYTRDSATGLDYADQRYYANNFGRLMVPDPSARSLELTNPATWNRYSYVLGDPVNLNDPLGLCAAMLGGASMGPGGTDPTSAAFAGEQASLQADTGFPYSDESFASAGLAVINQNASSTATALSTLLYALSTTSGSIDVIAYSGGAQAFASALSQLSAADKARIGNILYISPVMGVGTLPTLGLPYPNVTVVESSDFINNVLTAGTAIPSGVRVINTPCAHTDLACQLKWAPLAQITSDGPCPHPASFSRKNFGATPRLRPPMFQGNIVNGNPFYFMDLMFGGMSEPESADPGTGDFAYAVGVTITYYP